MGMTEYDIFNSVYDILNGALKVNVVAGGGGGIDPVGLKNTGGVPVNPATEDTLSGIEAVIEDKELIGNTQADGSGTKYHITTDSSGRLHTRSFKNAAGDGRRMLVDDDRHGQVDVLSSALPAGAATSIKQGETAEYGLSDKDMVSDTQYIGYTDKDGKWYIMKLTDAEARYVKGDTGYVANWTGRAGLIYQYYYEVF